MAHPASSLCSPVIALFSSALQKDASRAGSAQSIVIPVSRFVMQAPWHPGSGARTAAPADPHTRTRPGDPARTGDKVRLDRATHASWRRRQRSRGMTLTAADAWYSNARANRLIWVPAVVWPSRCQAAPNWPI